MGRQRLTWLPIVLLVIVLVPACTGHAPAGPSGSGRIAYASPRVIFSFFGFSRTPHGYVYVMDADGSDRTLLADEPYDVSDPAWSPDGSRIAFSSFRDGTWHIFVMDADGSHLAQLTDGMEEDGSPTWSPDGRRVAFDSKRYDFNKGIWLSQDIYVMDADGSHSMNLIVNPAIDTDPAWSPDGMRIAFSSNRDGNGEIYVMDADGSHPTRLTHDPGSDFAPVWSPDGRRIAFTSDRDGNYEIYVMDADGSNPIRLTDDPNSDLAPAWSPDGRRITFASHRSGHYEIYVMGIDGSGLIQLTDDPKWDSTDPTWQP